MIWWCQAVHPIKFERSCGECGERPKKATSTCPAVDMNIVFHSSDDIILRAQFQLGKDPERVGLCYIYIHIHIFKNMHNYTASLVKSSSPWNMKSLWNHLQPADHRGFSINDCRPGAPARFCKGQGIDQENRHTQGAIADGAWAKVFHLGGWKILQLAWWETLPKCSMYGLFTYISHKNCPIVGQYSIHGTSGLYY